jgi:hypothetical protein
MSRGRARLARDYGMDPETQNLVDGSWKWPTVRQMLGYNSPERRLERRIIRRLLDSPEASELTLNWVDFEKALGAGWLEQLRKFTTERLRKVQYLVSESGVAVSVRWCGLERLTVRVIK